MDHWEVEGRRYKNRAHSIVQMLCIQTISPLCGHCLRGGGVRSRVSVC